MRGFRHKFRCLKVARTAISTFMLPSSAAPSTSSATSCVKSSAKSYAASFTCLSFTCHLRKARGAARVCWACVPQGPIKQKQVLFQI